MATGYITIGGCPRIVLQTLLVLLLVLAGSDVARAQPSWTYSPYAVQVWFAVDEQPEFTEQQRELLNVVFQQQSWAVAGATWQMQTADAPQEIRAVMLRHFDSLTAEQLLVSDKKLAEADKLMLVRISKEPGEYLVTAREFDVRTRLFGPKIDFHVPQRDLIPREAFRAVTTAFLPLGRIDDVREGVAVVRVRAGGLVTEPTNPCAVQAKHVMFAVLRQNDRRGQVGAGGIRVIDWTLLEVTEADEGNVKCTVHTANKAYLSGRSSSRIERLALGLKVLRPTTTLEVVSRDEQKRPLVGYYIYSKHPVTEEVKLLGQTDWRGRLEIPPTEDGGVRLLYVRSGDALLARLPLVTGQIDVARAELTDDEVRLQAEALVRGIQGTLVDVVAQQQLLAARIRKLIKEGNYEKAQLLITQFRELPTVAELREQVDRAKQGVVTKNNKVQARIDIMFAETHELIARFVDPKLIDVLSVELSTARQQPAPPPSEPSTPPPPQAAS